MCEHYINQITNEPLIEELTNKVGERAKKSTTQHRPRRGLDFTCSNDRESTSTDHSGSTEAVLREKALG
jgi:hypothetical protein